MKIKMITGGLCFLLASMVAQATPVLVTGTPGNATRAVPTPASPNLQGTTVNFDNLTPFDAESSFSSQGVTVSSPDGLTVFPFSAQSAPNELFDSSTDGSANIFINLTQGAYAIGVGIADSDPVTILIQALGAGGIDLGSAFSVTIPEANPDTAGNGYFVIQDGNPDILGLQITQPVGDLINFSGLAIDDVQVAYTPEPNSFVLMATGLIGFLGFNYFRMMKRA